MAHFALLWKARTIEKYRQKYENEKINSIIMSNAEIPDKTLFQRWRHYSHGLQNRLSRTFSKWYPEGTTMSNFYMSFRTDNMKLPHILLRSLYGFVGGLLLTYLGFMFFVFQLSLSLVHATVLSSVLGILITLGLTFSNRIRCLIFLLIPQLFSRVGRYTLTCYALVLILTGPATNTLKNSEVLSESMACSQEQIKANVNEINKTIKKPFNSIKDSMKITIQSMKLTVAKLKKALIRINRLILSIASVTQSGYSWLGSVTETCNDILGKPYDKCMRVMKDRISNYEEKRNAHRNKKSSNSKDNTHTIKNSDVKDPNKDDKLKGGKIVKDAEVRKKHYGILRHALNKHSTNDYWATIVCSSLKTYNKFCVAADFVEQTFLATIRRKIRTFINRLSRLLYVKLNFHHSYIFIGNSSTNSQIASGIVTEIRNRADPILTWLSWSSCVTSLFLLLIIFRAKHYQHMFETRSRFDNRFITKEFRELDLKRLRERRETVLPLNRRERAKYVTTTSFRLVGSEKIHLNRSAVFMTVTTFKLLIHIVADYSLYWVLMTIRQHGKLQSPLHLSEVGSFMSGSGFVSHLLQSFIDSLNVHLSLPPLDNACLPNPYPPDVKRYCQIGFLIFLLWFFAIFEPYGLRLRHIIMGHYRPERAKTRAVWLYNHILRTRGSFMKFARRRLHREYKYSSQSNLTLRSWLQSVIPFGWLRSLLGIKQDKPRCLLCNITEKPSDRCTALIKCQVPACPGTYCKSCFTDIGELCTICLAPSDYGDLSDMSLERGSSNDDSSDDNDDGDDFDENDAGTRRGNVTYRTDTTSKASKFDKEKRFMSIMERKNETGKEIIPLIKRNTETDITKHVCFQKSEVTAMQILSNKSESPFKFTQINLENKIHKKDYYKTSIYRRDENNNNVPLQLQRKGITTSLLQYSAYKIKPTGKPFIMKTKQNLTLLAKYLRKKGIIRCRKNKAMKKKQKRIYKKKKYRTKTKKNNAKKRLNKENSIRKRKIYQTKKSQKVNVSYFMTCSTPRNDDKENCNEIKKSDDCEDEKNDEKKTEDDPHESKSIGNNNETHELNNKSKNSATRCICMQKIHTLLHKYCFNQKSATLVKKSKTNSTCVKEMTHVKKKKRKKPKSQSKSVKIRQKKDFPKNSRLLAYLDEWDWMQNHFASHRPTTVKKNLHTKKNNVYKDRKLTNIDEKADVEIVNDVEIPHLNLKLITETTVEVEDDTFVKDPTTVGDGITLQTRNSFTRGALDRFFKTMFICRPFSRKEIKFLDHSCSSKDKKLTVCNKANETKEPESQHNKRVLTSFQSNRLPRPYSLLKSVYSSLLLRLNMGNESVATVDSKKIVETDNKEVTVLPKTCSCAVQYDLETERIETADFSAQVDLIVQDKTKLLVDAQVSAVQTMCTCATQYQIANVNIGTSYTNSALAVLDCITEAMNNSQSLPSDQFSTQSEETQTNTTMCSISHTRFNCAQYEDKQPKRFKDTCLKSHQFTITERPKNRDVSTTTFDWWSPMSDKKVTKCEKKEKKKRRDYEVAKNEEQKIERKVTAAEKLVKFNSSAQVIPNNCLFDKTRQGRRTLEDSRFDDIISPSRYLLESQRYYNELFYSSFNVRPAGGKMDQVQKQQNPERSHSQVCCRQKNRRGRKTNRLEDTSIQANPRERSE